mmetsp:Transcript_28451/g.50087  ORF Transcript_28451/g.50087 Transcript_28451/m.50087 type:complete len:215 (+) Transcript_28451:287-931(+)
MWDGLFGRKKVPIKVQVKEWCKGLSKESRGIERKIREIRRDENKVKAQIKKLAKDKNNIQAIRIMAKGLVASRKTCDRLFQAKAQINSVNTQLKLNYAQMQVSQTMEKSGEIMKTMGQLMKLKEVQANCKVFAKQMMKAGVIQDVMEDAFEMLEDPDVEEMADNEVDKVLYEVTQGQLGKVQEIKGGNLPKQEEKVVGEEKDTDIEDMKKRLAE